MVKMAQILKAKKAKQSLDTSKSTPGQSRSGNNAFSIDKVRKTPAGKGPKGR